MRFTSFYRLCFLLNNKKGARYIELPRQAALTAGLSPAVSQFFVKVYQIGETTQFFHQSLNLE